MTEIKQGQLFPPINSLKNLRAPRPPVAPRDIEYREPAGIKTPVDMLTLNGAFRWHDNERRVIDDSDLTVDYQKLNILSIKKQIVKHKVSTVTSQCALGSRQVSPRAQRPQALTTPLRPPGLPQPRPAARHFRAAQEIRRGVN